MVLEDALTSDEVMHFVQLYDDDREKFGPPNCWHPFDGYQTRNCNALVTSPGFDKLLRHPKILPLITFLMGGLCVSPKFAFVTWLHMMENHAKTFIGTVRIGRVIRFGWTMYNSCFT